MPYFKTTKINLLYIHIPKTGGMSVEQYFYEKYKIPKTYKTAYGYSHPDIDFKVLFEKDQEFTLQHLTYQKYCKYGYLFDLDILDTNLNIITTVRNPYERIISDMFFFVVQTNITIDSTKKDIEDAIRLYLNRTDYDYDNHRLPQYKFLIDEDGNIPRNVVILKTEILRQEMQDVGFLDFNYNENKNRIGKKIDYFYLLTNESIHMINDFYDLDFKYFGYTKIGENKI